MTNPIFDTLPAKYHDRVRLDSRGEATITVDDGAFTVPVITEADRAAMNLPPGRHRDRVRDDEHPWYPPTF